MTTSQKNFTLCKPTGSKRIPVGDLAYMQVRNRYRAYELVLKELEKSGVSQADLARRLGKKPEDIRRLLGAPGNWTLDAVSDLLFAISGAEVTYGLSHPCDMPNELDDITKRINTDAAVDRITPEDAARRDAKEVADEFRDEIGKRISELTQAERPTKRGPYKKQGQISN